MDNILQTFRKLRHKKRELWGAAPETEERLSSLAEADPAVPSAMLERSVVWLHATGPRAARYAVLPPIWVPAETGIYNQFIGKCKGSMGMHPRPNPQCATAIVHKITLFIQVENCDIS